MKDVNYPCWNQKINPVTALVLFCLFYLTINELPLKPVSASLRPLRHSWEARGHVLWLPAHPFFAKLDSCISSFISISIVYFI